MQFTREDNTGQALITTLVHELHIATDNFEDFIYFLKILQENKNRRIELKCYQTYADYLRNLYEYYVGIFKLNNKSTKDLKPGEIDELLNNVVERLIDFYSPTQKPFIQNYPEKVPKEFGRDYRVIRNRISHADYRRVLSSKQKNELSLGEFYQKYNFFISMMLVQAQFTWRIKDLESYDWKEIGEFSNYLTKKPSKNELPRYFLIDKQSIYKNI